MGRKSTIEQLPEDLLKQLQALLLDPRITQLQVTAQINELLLGKGHAVVSKSAVGRYAQSFEEITAEMVETERMASLMMAEMNISNQSNIGQVISENLRVMMFHFMPMLRNAMKSSDLDVKDMKNVVGMLKDLTAGHERLEQSATINEKRKHEIEKKAAEALIIQVEETQDSQPLTADRLRQLLKETYGG